METHDQGGAIPKVEQWKGRVRRSKLWEMTSFNNKQHYCGCGLGFSVKGFKWRGQRRSKREAKSRMLRDELFNAIWDGNERRETPLINC